MTKIIAFWGAPGAGKSGAAFSVAGRLKSMGVSVELVPEFPKELAWAGDTERLKDQLYIFAEQNRRLYSLQGKVDWIVTDMALPITIPYLMMPERSANWNVQEIYIKAWKHDVANLITRTWDMYNTYDVFIKRDVPYDQSGRMEDEQQSKIIENILLNDFNKFGKNRIITKTSTCTDDVISSIRTVGNF